MDIFKVLAICFIATILAVIIKQYKGEYALFISLAAGVIIFAYIINSIKTPLEVIKSSLSKYEINLEYFKVAFKALLIGYITSFIADACRDSGQSSLATKAELAGKCAIFILSIPLIISVLETAVGFIQ